MVNVGVRVRVGPRRVKTAKEVSLLVLYTCTLVVTTLTLGR